VIAKHEGRNHSENIDFGERIILVWMLKEKRIHSNVLGERRAVELGVLVFMEILDHINNYYVSFFVATGLFFFIFSHLDEYFILRSFNNSKLKVVKVKLRPTIGHKGPEGSRRTARFLL